MNKKLTGFLKGVIFLIGIIVLVLCICLVPPIANFAANVHPTIVPMNVLVFIVMYGAAVPFYFALYQAFNLLRYIEENKTFSTLSVKALKSIKFCAVTISCLYVAGSPLFHFITK